MPKARSTTPQLDVLVLRRNRQRRPHLYFSDDTDSFRAALVREMGGGPLTDPVPTWRKGFSELVAAAQAVMVPLTSRAGVLTVDFKARRGAACGSFVVYGLGPKGVEILHDHSLPAQHRLTGAPVTSEDQAALYRVREIAVSWVRHDGLDFPSPQTKTREQREAAGEIVDAEAEEAARRDPKRCEFSFEGYDQVAISSAPLHWNVHWPPRSLAEIPRFALEREERSDLLLALWSAKRKR